MDFLHKQGITIQQGHLGKPLVADFFTAQQDRVSFAHVFVNIIVNLQTQFGSNAWMVGRFSWRSNTVKAF